MKTRTLSTTVTAQLSADGKFLIVTLPVDQAPKLTKNQKSYVIAETGSWPQNWVTVLVEGEQVGLTVTALIANDKHPSNQPEPVAPVPAPVPVAPAVPATKFFTGRKAASNGHAKRIMPGTVA